MKLPGGFDMNSMMKQAQKMQEQMGKEMKEMKVDASAGGGAVTVQMRGDFEVLELVISPDLVKDGDVEMIQDLTLAARRTFHGRQFAADSDINFVKSRRVFKHCAGQNTRTMNFYACPFGLLAE